MITCYELVKHCVLNVYDHLGLIVGTPEVVFCIDSIFAREACGGGGGSNLSSVQAKLTWPTK